MPDFVIVGAAKSATTWLSDNLGRCPDAFIPGPEPHFFSDNFSRGLGWYEEWFREARPEQVVGEKSADYLAHPDAAARLRRVLPNARLVVQLRNPVDRAYSDYCMLFRRGEVGPAPERYLDPGKAEVRRFLDGGLYGRHLAAYYALFPRDQIKVILYDDIRRDPERIFAEVCEFLGLDPARRPGLGPRVKVKEAPMLPRGMRRLLAPLKPRVEPLRSHPAFRAAHALLARPVRYPPLAPDLRRRMWTHFSNDVRALEQLLGRDLRDWRPAEVAAAE